jgi:hypothetical protein
MTTPLREAVVALAESHPANHIAWPEKGRAPPGYVPGIAAAYAQVYQAYRTGGMKPFVSVIAGPNTHDAENDALSYYAGTFADLGMSNNGGSDSLRHAAVLAAGLGMRESDGGDDIGRDRSAGNLDPNKAEAGDWQMSRDIYGKSPLLSELYDHLVPLYDNGTGDDLAAVFYSGVHHTAVDLEDFGPESSAGYQFQKNLKRYPALAFWMTLLGLRVARGHWGPIDTRRASVQPAMDRLLIAVQALVDNQEETGAGA